MLPAPQTRTPLTPDAKQTFARVFGGPCRVFRAPGRVNLIGEHTDYNLGFVMPAAVDLYCSVAIAPRSDRELHVYSAHFAEKFVGDLETPSPSPRGDWSDYVIGTAIALENFGYKLRGANLVVSGQRAFRFGFEVLRRYRSFHRNRAAEHQRPHRGSQATRPRLPARGERIRRRP